MAQDDFEEFAKRVKQAESGDRRYDSKGNLLTSPKGAQGEMQVMPGTQKSPGFGVEPARAKTGEEIARVGKDYLRAMEQRYGNKEYAAVAYNWGPGNADKWIAQGADFSKLPKETQDYVKKVAPSAAQAEQKPVAPTEVPDYKALGRGPMTADLGSGYKAALALAFLGDEEDSDEKKLDEEDKQAAKELADYKSFNALNELEFGPTKVPQLTAQAQSQVPVQHFADGGMPFVPTALVRPSAKRQLEDVKAQYDAYNTQANQYNAALQKYQAEQYDPYMAKLGEYNKAVEAWNAGPRTSDFTGVAPTAPEQFSMAAPTAPTTTQEQYNAMGAAAKRDIANRNLALQVAADPERFGLSINKFFADGGEVQGMTSNSPLIPEQLAPGGALMLAEGGEVEEPWLPRVSSYSQMTATDMYPGQQGQFDQQDAARHMLAAGTLARKYGPGVAEALGQAHEITTSPLKWIGSKLGISQMPIDYEQDLHNNRVGIDLATRSKSQKELEDLVQREAERARSQQTPGTAWIGRPVRRADGSPEGGERALTPEEIEAASKPAFLTPKSGIGRKISTKPGEIEAAALQGASETPYNLLGAPVDLATMAMRPFGYDVKAPIGGSDWIKEKMTALGIRPEAPTQPTQRAFYELGQAGAGAVNPAAPVRGAVAGAQATGKAAKELLQDFQQYNRQFAVPGASYAVREPGGPLLQVPQRYGHTWVDNKTGETLDYVDPLIPIMHDLAGTPDHQLNEWFRNKVGSYIRRDMGTEKDQFVKAADEGRRLHFVEKPGPEFTMTQAAEETPHSVQFVRQTEGFSPQGSAKTPYGRLVENKTDWSIWPMEAGSLLEDTDEKLLLPIVRDLAKANPQMRVHEINPQIEEHLGLTTLRDKMFKMRQMSPEFSAYNQPAVKIPERYMFTDQTLQGLTPAQASERVAQFDTWKQEARQKMASQAVLKDPALSRTPASDGHVWINPPDLELNPALRTLIQDVGCDGGWCTKNDYQAISNGSGENRLSVLMDSKARPKAQMTITSKDMGPDDFLASLEPEEMAAFKANNPDVTLWREDSITGTPEYQHWKSMNPPSMSITEIKGVNNSTDLRNMPYLKQLQDRIKDLDSRFNLQNVDNLTGVGMTDMSSHLWGHPAIANRPPIGRDGMTAVMEEAARLNNGSRFIENDKAKIDSIFQQAADNILGPEGPKGPTDNAARMIQKSMFQARATGGLIERRTDDSRKYM